jgi:tetratricopeptide (TPR) repeat protein
MSDTKRGLLLNIALIVLVGLLSYGNSFDASFHFDDFRFISENPLIRDFGYFTDPSKVDELDLSDDVKRYFKTRKVGFLSLWENYRLGHESVLGYHAVNLAIHLTNALLVYLLVSLLFMTPFLSGSRLRKHSPLVALFSGLLFVAHPINTESVTYILQRLVVLTAMFYLLSTSAYIASRISTRRAPRFLLYALSIVAAILAMETKENAFTLPFAIVLIEFSFFTAPARKRLLLLVPVLVTLVIIPLAYLHLDTDAGLGAALEEATSLSDTPRSEYLLTEFRVIVSYMRMMLFPVGQNVDHDQRLYHSLFEPQVFLSFLFLLGIILHAIYLFQRSQIRDRSSRLVAFGFIWFFLALSVESSVLPISERMVEYRLYLPGIGFIIAAVSAIFFLYMRFSRLPKEAAMLLIALTIVFALATHARNTVWRSEVSLWQDSARKSPNKARPNNNLCKAYLENGRPLAAVPYCQRAIELRPGFVFAHNNLGRAYLKLGRTDMAIDHFIASLNIDPLYIRAHNNLAAAYIEKKWYNKAIAELKKDLALDPTHAMAYYNLGIAYQGKGRIDDAIIQYRTAIKYRPDYKKAHLRLERALIEKEHYRKVKEHFE